MTVNTDKICNYDKQIRQINRNNQTSQGQRKANSCPRPGSSLWLLVSPPQLTYRVHNLYTKESK